MKPLPNYKPSIGMEMKRPQDKYPKTLPYVKEGKLFLNVGVQDKTYLGAEKLQRWKDGEIHSPTIWWLTYYRLGHHPNYYQLPKGASWLFLEELYHANTQLKLAMGHPIDPTLLKLATQEWVTRKKTLESSVGET